MRERILFVEDDPVLRRATAIALRGEGYEVLEAADAETGHTFLRDQPPDLMILDVMLPGQDGFEAAREVRKSSDVPIIFLTAKTDMVDVVVGLESGGDDYLTKPFETKELIARIRALLRRVRVEHVPRKMSVGDLEIEPEAGTVRKSGRAIPLTKTEFELLISLASRPNQIFTREILLGQVWNYDYLGDTRLVDVAIRRLRSKIEDDPANPTLIETVRGYGYRLRSSP